MAGSLYILTDEVHVSSVDRIDLLFMIDNSPSMADKQRVLALAVPDLVSRLTDPPCVAPRRLGARTLRGGGQGDW